MTTTESQQREFLVWMGVICVISLATFWLTNDRVNWLLDAGWVAAGLPILWFTRNRFPLTPILIRLLALHAIVLIAGGYWTYEKNPIGLWFQHWMGTERNHYDRFGHFLQGFVPAILFREIYARTSPIQKGAWLNYFSLISCLAFTCCFELLEWGATVLSGAEGDAFLGHQGDVWDAQWDMLWAFLGSLLSLVLLSMTHSQQLKRLTPAPS